MHKNSDKNKMDASCKIQGNIHKIILQMRFYVSRKPGTYQPYKTSSRRRARMVIGTPSKPNASRILFSI